MTTIQSFDGLGIAPTLMEVLDRHHFKIPTPIQYQSIPPALAGEDIIGVAQTGTGKTLAFGIPLIQRIFQMNTQALIVLPTRELAVQVDEMLTQIGRTLGLKTAVLIGGQNMQLQLKQLKRGPHMVIATPGRLNDHLERRTISLSKVTMLVLDEADRMLDMGFEAQIRRIIQTLPEKRQTLLFSATMPIEIVKLANRYMKTPLRVEVAPSGTAASNVIQEIYFVRREDKLTLLENVLKKYQGSILLFSRTKFGAKKIATAVRNFGHSGAEIHSNRTLSQRFETLKGFKLGKYRVLVATDIAARGIDVTGIELVVNYDLPENANDYVHRIGRTGRAGHDGRAISFATPDQRGNVKDIERLIKTQLQVAKLPDHMQSRAPIIPTEGGASDRKNWRSFSSSRNGRSRFKR